jgi:nucleoid DNA-binding protein
MAKIPMKEAIKLTAQYVGCSYEVANTIIESYAYIVYKLLLEGYDVRMPLLGRFYLKTKPEQPAKVFKVPLTGEVKDLPPKPSYQKPAFKFTPAFKKEIREKTEGNLL